MTDFAVVDCHGHIFPPLAGACGFPSAEAHLVHQQRAMHVHGNQPYRRLRDHAVTTERHLWRADDPSEAGRATDVGFRVGRFGRFEWERDGERYYVQFLPPHMEDLSAPPEGMVVEMDYAGVGTVVLQNDHIYGNLAEYFAEAARRWPGRFVGLAQVDEPFGYRDDGAPDPRGPGATAGDARPLLHHDGVLPERLPHPAGRAELRPAVANGGAPGPPGLLGSLGQVAGGRLSGRDAPARAGSSTGIRRSVTSWSTASRPGSTRTRGTGSSGPRRSPSCSTAARCGRRCCTRSRGAGGMPYPYARAQHHFRQTYERFGARQARLGLGHAERRPLLHVPPGARVRVGPRGLPGRGGSPPDLPGEHARAARGPRLSLRPAPGARGAECAGRALCRSGAPWPSPTVHARVMAASPPSARLSLDERE